MTTAFNDDSYGDDMYTGPAEIAFTGHDDIGDDNAVRDQEFSMLDNDQRMLDDNGGDDGDDF